MIKSHDLMVIVLLLTVGIALGLMISGWTSSLAAEGQVNGYTIPIPSIPEKGNAVAEAVPSAAHLALWEEDFELLLPFVSKDP